MKNLTKNIVLGLLVLLILIAGMVTLGSFSSKSEDEVTLWTLQMGDFADYMNGVIKDFEAENPNIKIKWVDVPFSEGEKRTLASVLSDNPPDLINLNPDFSATLAQKGTLYEIPEEVAGQFNSSVLNSLRYNGKLYSLPWYATSAVTIYNKDLISRAGVSVPKLTKKSGKLLRKSKKKRVLTYFCQTLPKMTLCLKS